MKITLNMNIAGYHSIMSSVKLFALIGLLLVVTAAAATTTSILHFSNFGLDDIFSSMPKRLGNFLGGPIHAAAAQDQYMKTTVTVKNTTLVADLALSPDQQSKGLSGRQNLSDSQAMLFVMKAPGMYGFWMKEMKFPLDIFWLDSSGKVVYIKENLQPCLTVLNCPTYTPDMDSLYVLETVAGFAQRHQIAKGTHFNFQLPNT
jgi:uncharacterized protein